MGALPAGYLNDLCSFDPMQLAWTDQSGQTKGQIPGPRAGCFFAAHGGLLYLFGGWSEAAQFLNDLFVLDPATLVWTDLTPVAHSQRLLVTHGPFDPVLPFEEMKKQVQRLQKAGLNVDWREFPKDHTVYGQEEVTVIRNFVKAGYLAS